MKSSDDVVRRARALERSSFYELFDVLVENSEILNELRPIERRPWLANVIKELHESQDGKCVICGEPLKFGDHEVDHKIPFCYGGGNERANLQITCVSCNRQKSNSVDPVDLLRYLEDRYMNR